MRPVTAIVGFQPVLRDDALDVESIRVQKEADKRLLVVGIVSNIGEHEEAGFLCVRSHHISRTKNG
jgi:hypothetical protein